MAESLTFHAHGQDWLCFWSERGRGGFLSNWYPCSIVLPSAESLLAHRCGGLFTASQCSTLAGKTFRSSEHLFMFCKALYFDDEQIARALLLEPAVGVDNHALQRRYKDLGRAVRNFNALRWNAVMEQAMDFSLALKFSQNLDLRAQLKATGACTLVEASAYDAIWGVGIDANAFKSHVSASPDAERQLGQNLLGKCLERVRATL